MDRTVHSAQVFHDSVQGRYEQSAAVGVIARSRSIFSSNVPRYAQGASVNACPRAPKHSALNHHPSLL
ncbi:MAG: hypothetical protein ACLR0U_31110 [Enterocloster clostridioformis]